MKDYRIKADPDLLRNCLRLIFVNLGVRTADAEVMAENLVFADLRGIPSHGVARLKRYVEGLKSGLIKPVPDERKVSETSVITVVDAGGGAGQPAGKRAMEAAIEKAKKEFVGFSTVRNSNHYGIAAYYSMMALEHDMIGISTTNSDVLMVPTFGRDAVLGTNPLSVAVPGRDGEALRSGYGYERRSKGET